MMRFGIGARCIGLSLLVACGESSTTPSPSPSAAPSAGASSTPNESAIAPTPGGLKRTATPAERFASDQQACDGGDKTACRRVADRFSATGLDAGCGVPRGRPAPSLKRVQTDTDGDQAEYKRAMKKACALGDEDACALARIATDSFASGGYPRLRFSAARRDPSGLGIWVFRSKSPLPPPEPRMPPRDDAKALAERRKSCLEDFAACTAPDSTLFRQTPAPKDGKLPAEVATLAREVCETTHDCDDIYIALDKAHYAPEALAPVRSAFASTLTAACVAGECTCGDATLYLPPDDPSRLDLAILGCENGEAEGCAVLASAYENGRGVPKDETKARALYDLACPPVRPIRDETDYSPHACDRLAELYAGGPYPGKDRDRGIYYAEAACQNPGHEFDHAPCIRRAMLWATKKVVTRSEGTNRGIAESIAYGSAVDFNHECERPSVAAQCKEFEAALPFAK